MIHPIETPRTRAERIKRRAANTLKSYLIKSTGLLNVASLADQEAEIDELVNDIVEAARLSTLADLRNLD